MDACCMDGCMHACMQACMHILIGRWMDSQASCQKIVSYMVRYRDIATETDRVPNRRMADGWIGGLTDDQMNKWTGRWVVDRWAD